MSEVAESLQPSRGLLVSRPQAAKLAQLTRRQLANLMDDGRVRTVPIGGRVLVVRSSLDALIRDLNGRPA
jgi:hypothetical protein